MEQRFPRHIGALDEVFRFIGGFFSKNTFDESVAYSITLAAEELFTNMVKYNSGSGKEIAIRVDVEDGRFVLELIDFDVEPFDPASIGKVDVEEPLGQRKIGGLGLHLVRSVVDKITYEYRDRRMKVTAIKNVDRKHV